MKRIIAIDGPAAAGKGTLARRLAATLGLPYLDTGLLYRAVGRRVLDAGGNPADPATAEAAARSLRPEDLDRPDLRGPQADSASSAVAAIPAVRAALLAFQRDFANRAGAVLDGRDIGTVIFPEADLKTVRHRQPARTRSAALARTPCPRNRRRPCDRRTRHAPPRQPGRRPGHGTATARRRFLLDRYEPTRRRCRLPGRSRIDPKQDKDDLTPNVHS